MKPCPNCGQDVAGDSDRFCPHCGYLLPRPATVRDRAPVQPTPVAPQGAAPASPAPQGAAPASPSPQPAYQPRAEFAPPPVYTAPAPDPRGYSAPSYTSGGPNVGNLPAPRVQRTPTPVAPATGADPAMNTLMTMVRSVVSLDARGLLILAAAVLAAIVVAVIVAKAVFWLLHILPWLLLIAAIVYVGQRARRRWRRLP
jgi:zinc-ribbon domain